MKLNFFKFKKDEKISTFIIFALLVAIIGVNLRVSFRKSRDAQRKSDIRSIYDALQSYQKDFGFFPKSDNGKIVACLPEGYDFSSVDPESPFKDFIACEYLGDALRDVFDESYPPYLPSIPSDPHHAEGALYYYVSNGSRFQIYGALEGSGEPEYDEAIIARNLRCGNQICNFGKAYSNTPLDKSIEEFESDL